MTNYDVKKITDIIKNGRLETIQLKIAKLWEVYTLENGSILCVCNSHAFMGETFLVFDDQLNLLKRYDTISVNYNQFNPYIIALKNQKDVYLSTYDGRIVITDLKFEVQKLFENHDFKSLKKSCTGGGFIIANNIRKIRFFNLDLILIHTIDFNFVVKQIEASDHMVIVIGDRQTLFFSLSDNFKLVYKYRRSTPRCISVINSNFFEISSVEQKIWCYDSLGTLIDEIELNSLDRALPITFEIRMFLINEILFMYSPGSSSLIKFV